MAVVARMFVQTITKNAWNKEAAQVTLAAATRGTENKEWASATPSANLTMTINNGAAAKFFEEAFATGADVHVTLDLAPDPDSI